MAYPSIYLIQPFKHPVGGVVPANIFKIGLTHVGIKDALLAYGKHTRVIDSRKVEFETARKSKKELLRHMRRLFKPYVEDGAKSMDWFVADEKEIFKEFQTFMDSHPGVKKPEDLWEYDSDLDSPMSSGMSFFNKYQPMLFADKFSQDLSDSDGDIMMSTDHVCSASCRAPCFVPFDILYPYDGPLL